DGNISYGNSAFKNGNEPAYYTIDLKQNYEIGSLGIALKIGYQESANVYFSTDGINWGTPVQSYTKHSSTKIDYKHFGSGIIARYVKVEITFAGGIPGLNEIELYGHKEYGADKLDLLTMYDNDDITVVTDMTWTTVDKPNTGVRGVFDGDVSYY